MANHLQPPKQTHNEVPPSNYDSRSGVNQYFTVHENEQVWSCKVCGAEGNAWQLRKLLTQGHNFSAPVFPLDSAHRKSAAYGQKIPWEGATVDTLAAAKGLDAEWLKNTLKWKTTTYPGSNTPVISMPYPDENNRNPLTRYRVGIGDENRFRWKTFRPGQRQRLYGLWDLQRARDHGFVILVEGETDFATLYHEGLPVLGIPGANNRRGEWAQYLFGLKVFLWIEPDRGGQTFLEKVPPTLPECWIIESPIGIKDPNEMFQQAGAGFVDWMVELTQVVTLFEPPLPEQPSGWDVFRCDYNCNDPDCTDCTQTGEVTWHHPRCDAKFPAILSDSEWQRLQERLTIRRELARGRTHSSDYLLSGILRCGHCGGPMAGK